MTARSWPDRSIGCDAHDACERGAMNHIKWVNTGSGARDDQGNWRSVEGRFVITPLYRHTVNPDDYSITDYMAKWTDQGTRAWEKVSFTTVRQCKAWAEDRIAIDSDKDIIRPYRAAIARAEGAS